VKAHEWRETTDEGETRLVRFERHGSRWWLFARLKSGEAFERIDPVPLEDLNTLLDVLRDKYRWGKAPHEHVLQVEALVEATESGVVIDDEQGGRGHGRGQGKRKRRG